MKSYLIISLIISSFLIFSVHAQAQVYDKEIASTAMQNKQLPPDMRDGGGSANSSMGSGTIYNDYLGTEGSMYQNDRWIDGNVVLADNSVLDDVKLRYNVYYKQMQFIQGPDTAAFSNPDEISHILLGEDKFIYTEFVKDNELSSDYFKVLADGPCKVLHRSLVKYHEVIEKKNCIEERFIKCCEFYIQTEGDAARQVKCNKKSVCSALGDKNEQIKAFIEGNDMKMKSEEDLIAVVDYYNSLHR